MVSSWSSRPGEEGGDGDSEVAEERRGSCCCSSEDTRRRGLVIGHARNDNEDEGLGGRLKASTSAQNSTPSAAWCRRQKSANESNSDSSTDSSVLMGGKWRLNRSKARACVHV